MPRRIRPAARPPRKRALSSGGGTGTSRLVTLKNPCRKSSTKVMKKVIAFAVESYLEDKLTRTELRKPLEQADPDRSSGTHNAYSTE